MKPNILIGLAITTALSGMFGWVFASFYSNWSWNRFFAGTFIGLGVQYLFNYYLVTRNTNKARIRLEELENERLQAYFKLTYPVQCPCIFKHIEKRPIDIGGDNNYSCERCTKPISLNIAINTALVTVPVTRADITKAVTDAPKLVEPDTSTV